MRQEAIQEIEETGAERHVEESAVLEVQETCFDHYSVAQIASFRVIVVVTSICSADFHVQVCVEVAPLKRRRSHSHEIEMQDGNLGLLV
jgi:hypothetical protein